jgi:hypothetical protein
VHTYATEKLVVPLGIDRLKDPELSVCAVNEPDPTRAATTVGVPTVNLKVTSVGVPVDDQEVVPGSERLMGGL